MLFFKKAIVKEVMPPVPPTVFAASVTFIRDVSTACSFFPPPVAIAANPKRPSMLFFKKAIVKEVIPPVPPTVYAASITFVRDVASSIEFNVPDSLKSMIGGHVAGILIFLMLMFTAVLFVLAIPTSTTDDSHQISKAATKVDDEGSSTALFSSGSSSGSSLDDGSTQDEDDAYRCNNEEVHVDSTPSMILSPEEIPRIATLQDVTTAEHDNTDEGDTTPCCVDEDQDLADLSVPPSVEEIIKVDSNDHTTSDLFKHVTPKTPNRDWMRERPTEANTPDMNPASVSVDSTPSMIPSPEELPGIATLQDVTTVELDNLNAGDTTPFCVGEDHDLADLSVTPSFEELIKVDSNDHTTTDLLDHVTPKTPDGNWKRERPTEANTPITNPASVSGSFDNEDGISASKSASYTPTRRDSSSSSKMSPLGRGPSSTKMTSYIGSPLLFFEEARIQVNQIGDYYLGSGTVCTGERVNLGLKAGRYCGMCYRKQVNTELKAKERKGRCRTSRLGCAICKEPICKECWKEGYDRHE